MTILFKVDKTVYIEDLQASVVVVGPTPGPTPKMVERSIKRFYEHRPMVSPHLAGIRARWLTPSIQPSGVWYGVCDFVVLSVVEVCADYDGVNVFHVCLNFGVVYGVSVNVCVVCFLRLGVVCFLRLGVVCCVVVCVGLMIFVLFVILVVGRCSFMGSVSVSSCRWYVFVSVVHPVAILSAVFCVICSLLMFCV